MTGYDLVIKGEKRGPRWSAHDDHAAKQLADYATSITIEDLPSEVLKSSCRILLDTIGVILGGSTAPQARHVAHRIGSRNGGSSTILGHSLQTSPLNAAIANGIAATWLDFDSGHRPPPGKPLLPAAHPPVHIVPATLAVAEAEKSSGADVLLALVAGYDVGARIGMGSRVRNEIHCHGTHHNVSAAAAAARLKGYTSREMETTIGLATHLSLMPSFKNALEGYTVRNVYAAVGSAMGILASQLAIRGFTPEYDAIGSVYGCVISPWVDNQRIVEDLGKRFEITLGFIKPYPMCRFGHPAIEAAEGLMEHNSINPKDIKDVEVNTFDWAAALDDRSPTTDLGAKFSVPWAVACVLVRGKAGPDEFRDEALADPLIRSVSERVTVREDPLYSSMTPAKRPARIKVQTVDGRIFEWEVFGSAGGPDAPLSDARVHEKFRILADPIIGEERASAVIDMVTHLIDLNDISELTRLLIPATAKASK